jgi:hypothetical protein
MKVIGQSMASTGNHLLLFVHDKRGGGRWTPAESIGLPGLAVDDAKAPYDTYHAHTPNAQWCWATPGLRRTARDE